MERFARDHLIAKLEEDATELTMDQRLRLAALLARPIPPPPTTTAAPPLVLTVEDAAQFLKVGRSTVYDLVRSGRLESITIGRLRRIRYAAVIAYLQQEVTGQVR